MSMLVTEIEEGKLSHCMGFGTFGECRSIFSSGIHTLECALYVASWESSKATNRRKVIIDIGESAA